MIDFLSNLLNIRKGERRRLVVLYFIMFLFSLSLTWGGSVAEAAFISFPGLGVSALPLILIADAVLSVTAIIIYTAFVDRMANDWLLMVLLLGFVITIALGRILMLIGDTAAAYIVWFVIFRASDSIFLLHWWTFVSEFYDIRAFKRLAPVILSAKTLGILVSGVTLPLLNAVLIPADVIVVWLCVQALIVPLVRLIPVLIREKQHENTGRKLPRESFIRNMREGYSYVRKSDYLRWFAIGSLALAVAAALFQSLSSQVMKATFPDQIAYANFLGAMNIIGGLITFPMQLFLMNRIINRVGVGGAMMIYPLTTALSSAALVFLPPQMVNSALGVLNRSVFRLAFRAPIMGLVYNVVPARVKGRARAFVSGLIEPIGAVIGSMLLIALNNANLPTIITILLGVSVIIYFGATVMTRQRYSTTLVNTLQQDEYSSLLEGDEILTVSDPKALNRLKTQFDSAIDPDNVFFAARLLAEVGGKDAVSILRERLNVEKSADIQLAILNALVVTQATTREVAGIYFAFIAHKDKRLRQVAIDGIEDAGSLTSGDYDILAERLDKEFDLPLQARLIPVVMRSPNPVQAQAARDLLTQFVQSLDADEVLLGLAIVADIHDARYLPTIMPLIQHHDDEIRLAAINALEGIAVQAVGLTLDQLDSLQHDHVERIREITLHLLQKFDDPEALALLLNGFRDPSRQVRDTTVRVLTAVGIEATSALEIAIHASETDLLTRKLATLTLCHIRRKYRQQYQREVEEFIVNDLGEIHHNHCQIAALRNLTKQSAGIRILITTLQEQNTAYLDEIFYLLTAFTEPQTISTLREALESESTSISAGALEALESIVSSQTARWISNQFDRSPAALDNFMLTMAEHLNLIPALTTQEALRELVADPDDSWLRASAVYALAEVNGIFKANEREELLKQAMQDSYADVRQAARAAHLNLTFNSESPQEKAMYSQIERILFLKQVSIFQSIPLEQLKAIAAVCEPESFAAQTVIFEQGEGSSGLYIVTSGKVAIEVKGNQGAIRLATLEANAYFGEMSLFNNRPRSATARTLEDTQMLKLSRVSFIRLVRQFPEMSLTLLDVLSQRLAELNEQLAEK